MSRDMKLLEDIAERLQSEFDVEQQPLTQSINEVLQHLSRSDGSSQTQVAQENDNT